MDTKIKKLMQDLELEEKAALCSGASFWQTKEIERLDIPSMLVSDGPHGVRYVADRAHDEPAKPATCFPTASAIAAAWDEDLAERIGKAVAKECKSLGVDILLGPGINMKRTPLGGRNFEYFSEDPYLTAELATSFIDAVQEEGIGTSLKHYTANNQETKRFSIDAQIDERPLREIYLAAFERVVKESQPWTVMCAYNQINGEFASEHQYLLTDILRDEWGFEGLVVSDWVAVHDRVAGVEAGLDLEMPGPSPVNTDKIVQAVEKGELEESKLDEVVRRNLEILFKAKQQAKDESFSVDEHHKLAREVASECIVLLKNENDLLPLSSDIDSLAVIGELAEKPRYQGAGSSRVNPTKLDIPYEKLEQAVSSETNINYRVGYSNKEESSSELLEEAVLTAKEAETAVVFAGLPEDIEAEGYDREDIQLPAQQNELIQEIVKVQPNTVVVLSNGAAIDLRPWIEEVPAVLEGWLTGQASGGAIADVLTGKVNPSGKLSETFPKRLEDNPSYLNFPGSGGEVKYGEGIYIGYRYYDKKKIEPLFPFGHGLSYTEFEYSNLSCPKEVEAEEGMTVEVEITNTGEVSGQEVIQLYLNQCNPQLDRPPKELATFKKVELEPGQAKRVELNLEYKDFAYYIPKEEDWIVETDQFKILLGSSSRDIRLEKDIQVKSLDTTHLLTKKSPLEDWFEDEKGLKALEEVLSKEQLKASDDGWIKSRPLYRFNYLSDGEVTEKEVKEIYEVYQKLN